MKKGIGIIALLAVGFLVYWVIFKKKDNGERDPKTEPIALKKHSAAFNNSVDQLVNAYLGIKDAYVTADTATAKNHTRDFIALLDSLQLDELKNDNTAVVESAKASVADIRSNAVSLLAQTDLREMRQDFRMVTEMMYPAFFKTINYEGPKLYLQHCPMAFDDDQGADWISNSADIVNPYLGKNHPKYKGTMLHCGEVKDTIKAQ
jgi:Protein of unknown function (DUF3347)